MNVGSINARFSTLDCTDESSILAFCCTSDEFGMPWSVEPSAWSGGKPPECLNLGTDRCNPETEGRNLDGERQTSLMFKSFEEGKMGVFCEVARPIKSTAEIFRSGFGPTFNEVTIWKVRVEYSSQVHLPVQPILLEPLATENFSVISLSPISFVGLQIFTAGFPFSFQRCLDYHRSGSVSLVRTGLSSTLRRFRPTRRLFFSRTNSHLVGVRPKPAQFDHSIQGSSKCLSF